MTETKPPGAPRELWIEFGGDPSNDKEVYKRYTATEKFEPSDFSDEVVHAIEKRAYDSLLAECEALRTVLAVARMVNNQHEDIRMTNALRNYDGK